LLATAAGLAAVVELGFAARTFYLSRRGQVTDRYAKAVALLASDTMAERVGAVYALEHVMRESAVDHDTVVSLLAAFVRERAPAGIQSAPVGPVGAGAPKQEERGVPSTDVQTALTVLARRPDRTERQYLHLSRTHLDRTDLTDAKLNRANLTDADLTGAVLFRAKLNRANLTDADLTGAALIRAALTGAALTRAHLIRADLTRAHLIRAVLSGADLTRAKLNRANLTDADLTRATLRDTFLTGADLTGAVVDATQLTGAVLDESTTLDAALRAALSEVPGSGPEPSSQNPQVGSDPPQPAS
jgi:hypothetical protein